MNGRVADDELIGVQALTLSVHSADDFLRLVAERMEFSHKVRILDVLDLIGHSNNHAMFGKIDSQAKTLGKLNAHGVFDAMRTLIRQCHVRIGDAAELIGLDKVDEEIDYLFDTNRSVDVLGRRRLVVHRLLHLLRYDGGLPRDEVEVAIQIAS